MRRIIFLATCLLAGFVFAGPHVLVPVTQTSVTNLIANPTIATNATRTSGFFEGVGFDITTGGPTATVVIATAADVTGESKTLWSGTVDTDIYIPVRAQVKTVWNGSATNVYAAIPLCGDIITISTYVGSSNLTLKSYIYVTDNDGG